MILVSQSPAAAFALPLLGRAGRGRLRTEPRQEITHRFTLHLEPGASEVIPQAGRCLVVTCHGGSLWITHDGDPKDLILGPGESHSASICDPSMMLFALESSAVEMQFSRQSPAA